MDMLRVKAVFDEVIMLPLADRAAALDRLCGSDVALRSEVDGLLAEHARMTGSLLSSPAEVSSSPAPSLVGSRLGRYEILREIGRGGMGVVYEARQEHPQRSVALKVVASGVMSPERLRRFEHEAEILGRLQHPGIAQIYEAGVAMGSNGAGDVPFFAMEFIKGEPLTIYAKTHLLSTRQRLELLVKICQAVQHAHQKGVIHRDLKPANILVDESGQPKILDFGIARATDSDLQATTLQTDVGQLIGTVQYMSPEQAAGDPNQLDTRSDVYALGVVAYELLADRLPYDLKKKMVHEAVRVIREDDPTPMSSIDRTLRGDVEIVVGKALEKEKDRRYQSAQEFASDIERYLKDEPIVARSPTTWYQTSKFARRNKALVSGLAATFVALLVGLIVALLLLQQTNAARQGEALQTQIAKDNAKKANDETERAKKAEAAEKKRANELDSVTNYQANLLSNINVAQMGQVMMQGILDRANSDPAIPVAVRDSFRKHLPRISFTDIALDTLMATILDPALQDVPKQFSGQPNVHATLLEALGTTLQNLGLPDRALAPLEEGFKISRQIYGEDGSLTLDALTNLAGVQLQMQQWAQAEKAFREVYEKRRHIDGDDAPATLTALNNLAGAFCMNDKQVEAEPLLHTLVQSRSRVFGPRSSETIKAKYNLIFVSEQLGHFDESLNLALTTLDDARVSLGNDDLETVALIWIIGRLHLECGRMNDAEPFCREAYERRRRILGDRHPDTLLASSNLVSVLLSTGRYEDLVVLATSIEDDARNVFVDVYKPILASLLGNLGMAQCELGHYRDAEPKLLEAYSLFDETQHPDVLSSIQAIASMYEKWNTSEPGKGFDSKAAEWRAKLAEAQATTGPASQPAAATTQP